MLLLRLSATLLLNSANWRLIMYWDGEACTLQSKCGSGSACSGGLDEPPIIMGPNS
jgi:hypothetical protein